MCSKKLQEDLKNIKTQIELPELKTAKSEIKNKEQRNKQTKNKTHWMRKLRGQWRTAEGPP